MSIHRENGKWRVKYRVAGKQRFAQLGGHFGLRPLEIRKVRWTELAVGYRRLRPAVKAATEGRVTGATTYTLRHSHASACHYVTTFTLPDILDRLGHSQQTHFLHYAHVIRAISGERYADLGALVAAARGDLVFCQSPKRSTSATDEGRQMRRFSCKSGERVEYPQPDSNRRSRA
jgi:hypothetical protein